VGRLGQKGEATILSKTAWGKSCLLGFRFAAKKKDRPGRGLFSQKGKLLKKRG